ncbi:hypothetical protein X945_6077 [Burkholderia pseudomallei ABCPW 107]|nr:hypothetical protein X945_6077 [Burkholderia pseudomallei ABCPW 107]
MLRHAAAFFLTLRRCRQSLAIRPDVARPSPLTVANQDIPHL